MLTLNNNRFEEEIINIYPPELTLKKLLNLILEYHIWTFPSVSATINKVYDKRENFNFNLVNYPYMCSNIPANPTYGVYVSQLVRISSICDNYVSFVKRHQLLTKRLIKQGFWYSKLSVSFKKFSRRHSTLFNK